MNSAGSPGGSPQLKISMGTKIAVGFAAALVVLLVTVLGSYRSTTALVEDFAWVERTHMVLQKLERVLTLTVNVETAARGYMIAGDERFLDPWDAARRDLPLAVQELRSLTSDSPEKQRQLDALELLLDAKVSVAKELVELRRAGETGRAIDLVSSGVGREAMERVQEQLGRMEEVERALLTHHSDASQASAKAAILRNELLCVLAFSFVALVGVLIRRDFVGRRLAEQALRDNHAQLQSILDNSTAVVYLKDLQGRFLLVNRRFESLFHVSKETLVGRTDHDLFPKQMADTFRAKDLQVVQSRAPLEVEEVVPHDDGNHTYLSIKFPLCDASGVPYAICGISTDISERKRMEKALEDNEERLSRIVETIADAVFILDVAGNVTFANSRAEAMFGMSRDVMTKRTHNDAAWKITTVEGKPFPTDQLPFVQAQRTGDPVYDIELAVERADGSRLCISVNSAALRDAGGTTIGVVASVCDITRRKEVERLKEQFVSTVSHELRTPLSSLRGFAELMISREFPREKQHEFLKIIHQESVRLTGLINDFLDIQRMESGHQTYDIGNLDALPVLQGSLTLFSGAQGTHRLRLEAPTVLPHVWADADRLRQVLSNLLSNAIKFSPHGGEITLGARREDEHLLIWVADQGIGIGADAQSKLFNKFFRVDAEETRSIGGTGLGLALVKEIVQAQGGNVWVESELGQGSTFKFTLPIAAEPAPALPAPRAKPGDRSDVLLVEDDPSFARLLSERFQLEGLSVSIVTTGEEALELARVHPPKLGILDIQIAGPMDGWDLIVEMKSVPALQAVPILVVSASDKISAHGLAVAGADYVVKPVSPVWLLETVKRHLPSRAGKRALVVDDDAGFRRQVVECLAVEPSLEVIEASDGREALEILARGLPDILLLDLLLPGIDGFEVLKHLRSNPKAANLPVLVITGKQLLPDEKAYLRRKMAGLVRKREVSLDHILRTAVQMMEASRSGLTASPATS